MPPKGRSSWSLGVSLTTSRTAATRELDVLNFSVPGPFEPDMPGIVQWFVENPPKDAGT
jgi:hypothetical protein